MGGLGNGSKRVIFGWVDSKLFLSKTFELCAKYDLQKLYYFSHFLFLKVEWLKRFYEPSDTLPFSYFFILSVWPVKDKP